MKKYKGLIIFISIILISVLVYIGLFLVCSLYDYNLILAVIFQLIGLIIVLPIFVAIHEAGHMVCGFMSGYSLLSYKVGPFEWYQKEDKIAFRVNPLSGVVLGQCLMSPPKPKKKVQPKFYLYNAGGLIFSYLSLLIFILLFFIISNIYVKFLLIPVIVVSLFLFINNSIYQKGGINDVCNYVLIKNNPKYINSVMYQLEMITNISSGKRYGAKTLYEPYYEERLNHISLPVVQFKMSQAIDKNDFTLVKELANLLRKNYHKLLLPIQKVSVIFDILYADIVIDANIHNFKRHYNWITEKEKTICLKYPDDMKYYYDIYTKIYNKDYNIKELVKKLINSDVLSDGEKLSVEKRFDFLLDKLQNM